jgi:putative MATE family efflux protein
MWIIDAAFLGRLGTAEQGAAGLAEPFLWTLLMLCGGVSTGVNIFVAQDYGAQSRGRCGLITWQGLYVNLLTWLLFLGGGLAARACIQLGQPSPDLLEPAVTYLRIRLLGALPLLMNFTLQGFFRGIGDTQTPLRVTILVNALNVLLDYLLIFGHAGLPRLGIAGAAVAAVLSTSVGSVLYIWLFLRCGTRQGLLTKAWAPFDRYACWHLIQVSWPTGLQAALEMSAWTLFTILVARLGAPEAAAHYITTNVALLSYMPGYGVSVAATTLVGQSLGAADRAAAWRSARACLVLVTLLMGTIGAGFFFWRHALVQFFTADPVVQQLGARLLIFAAICQIFDGWSLVAAGVLRGAGETRWPMLAGVILGWGFFVPLAYLTMFPLHGGVIGGWVVGMTYIILLGLTMSARLAQGQWQYRTLRSQGTT